MTGSWLRPRVWRNVVAALGVSLVAVTCRSGGDGEAGSDGDAQGLPRMVPAPSYSITYRVREFDRTREEHIVVGSPYESRRMSERGGEIIAGTLTNGDGLWEWVPAPEQGWQLVDPGRRGAEAEARLLATLPPLVDAGLAAIEGTDRVAGRACVLVRTAEPLGSAATTVPTDDNHTLLCLDDTGIMLRETWVIDGRTVRETEAMELSLEPALDDDEFDAIPRLAKGEWSTGKQLVEVTEDILASLKVRFELPDGVTADGADAWILRDPVGGVAGGSVRRFYRRGQELAEVEERETAAVNIRRALPFPTPLGEGLLESDLRRLTLHVPMGQGLTMTVRATSLALLEDLTQALVRRQGKSEEVGMSVEKARP